MTQAENSRDCGPAFPTTTEHGFNCGEPGMTLRDYFAAKAMQGMASQAGQDLAKQAGQAYEIADAMIKARNRGVEPAADAVPEPAPANSLPTWDECALRVWNSETIEQRVKEGGYGNEYSAPVASQLHRFIHEYDDEDPYRSAWFMHRLELLIQETKAEATLAAAPKLLHALETILKEAEQSAFEAWLCQESPSGDSEKVNHSWKESSTFADFIAQYKTAIAAAAKATGERE